MNVRTHISERRGRSVGAARDHYDRYPYDVGLATGDAYARARGPVPAFLATLRAGDIVVDVGCGPGNLLGALSRRGCATLAIDISGQTVTQAAARVRQAGYRALVAHADALDLPVAAGAGDAVLALGCLHHTGDARRGLGEVARVLRPGGRALVTLYRQGSYYHWMYRALAGPARRAAGHPLSDALVNRVGLFPVFWLYFWLGRFVTHRQVRPPSARQARGYFADQLLNPSVTFHTGAQVQHWASACGVRIQSTSTAHAGALLAFVVSRPGAEGSP